MAAANSARNRKPASLKVVSRTAAANSPEKIRELAFEVFHYAEIVQGKCGTAHAIAAAGQHWLNYEDADLTVKNLFGAIVTEVETNECDILVEKAESLRQLLQEVSHD